MHFLIVSLRKDWARVRRDPASLLTALGIPVVLAVLMSMVFGRAPVVPTGRLLVDDEDHSIASARFLDGFRGDALRKMITVEPVTRDQGRARIARGDGSAFLILPAGLQMAFLTNQPARLELFTNPSQRIIPQMIQETLTTTVGAAAYFQHGGKPLIQVENVAIGVSKPAQSFSAIFLPSSLFMGLLFIGSSTAGDIWKERTAGTLRRIAMSPVSMASYLAGRVVFVALLYLFVSVVGLLAADHLAGMPVPNLAAAALWITFAGVFFYLFFLFIAVQASTQRAANVLANLIIFPLAMLGGSFFPFEWMPGWMVSVGRLTPNGWALSQFKAILENAVDPHQLLVCAGMLTGLGAVAFTLTWLRIARVFAV
jgi:ABC-type multidrug transport system permease subunit